jgi:transcriptional regulator with XRE-family HTH domain
MTRARRVETISKLERGISLPNEATLRRLARSLEVSFEDLLVERGSGGSNRPIEFFRATELLKMMDEKQLKLAYNILKAIASG